VYLYVCIYIAMVVEVFPDETTSAGMGEEGGPLLVLCLSDHYVYIQSDLKHETDRWHKVLEAACMVRQLLPVYYYHVTFYLYTTAM